MGNIGDTARSFLAVILSLANQSNWTWLELPLPIPKTHAAYVAVTVFIVMIGLLLLVIWWLLANRKKLPHHMTIDIVEDTENIWQAQIKLSDAKKFPDVFGINPRTKQEDTVTLIYSNSDGKTKHLPCKMRVSQSSKIESEHLKVERELANAMGIGPQVNSVDMDIDIKPPTWLQSTFRSPDPNVRLQWTTGVWIGLGFTLLQFVIGWAAKF